MKCPSCGEEMSESFDYCARCGASLATVKEAGVETQPPVTKAPAPPPPGEPLSPPEAQIAPQEPHAAPAKKEHFSKLWGVLAIVLAVIIIGGVVAGIVIGTTGGEGMVAEIQSIDIERKDGKSLDLKKVPLGESLVLETTFRAQDGKGCKGTLALYLVNSENEIMYGNEYSIKVKEGTQNKDMVFHMKRSEGKPNKAVARLELKKGDEVVAASEIKTFVGVEGDIEEDKVGQEDESEDTSGETDLEEARKEAREKFEEAKNAISKCMDMGIDVDDLITKEIEASMLLESATTVEQLTGETDSVVKTCEEIIDECERRKQEQ